MKMCKGKNCFIKHNIPRDIDTPGMRFQTFEPFMKSTISKENTPSGSKRELSCSVWSKIWPTSTAKDAKRCIVWCFFEKKFSGRVEINDLTGKNVNKIRGCEESFIPEL
jgi:hypothetical protein